MAKLKTKLPAYYDGAVLNRERELEFHATQALTLRGQAFDLAVNRLMSMAEEYELSARRSPDDRELCQLAERGKELLLPLLAKLSSHNSGSKD